jgi:PAS domain S-box-containing protein
VAYQLPLTSELADLLAASDERFRAIFEYSTVGIAIVDLDGRLLLLNPAFSQTLGHGAPDLLGLNFGDLTHPADRALSQDVRRRLLDGPERRIRFDKRYLHKDGHEIWAEVSIALVLGADGRPSYFLTHVVDVSERIRAVSSLEEERRRLAVILASIGDGVIATDDHGLVSFMNGKAEDMTGWSQADALGMPIGSVFTIVDEITRLPRAVPVDEALSNGARSDPGDGAVLIARDGTERAVADSASPIKDGKGAILGAVLVFRDIAGIRRALQATQSTQRLESLGILAGGIAHDFNNLLSGIYGNLELARLQSNPAETTECLDAVFGTLGRARGLAHQLLTFSKGGGPVRITGALPAFLTEVIHFALSGSESAVSFGLPDDLWLCDFDPGQLGQAVDNIVINATQAMPHGGSISVQGRNVELGDEGRSGLGSGRYVELTIQDTGMGMSRQVADRVFEPFFTTKESGSGIGLSVAGSIIKAHHGAIEIESRLGHGTTIHILLPASNADAVVPAAALAATKSGSGRVLIMDDEEELRGLYEAMATRLGYEAVSAADGLEAVRILAEEAAAGRRFRAAIVDLTVHGGMGGIEAVARLKKVDPSLPVIVASGYAPGPALTSPEKLGFCGALPKPFTLGELSAVLARTPIRKGGRAGSGI